MTLDEFKKIVTEAMPGLVFRFNKSEYTSNAYALIAESWENRLTVSWVTENFTFNHPFTITRSNNLVTLTEVRQQKDLKNAIKVFAEKSESDLSNAEMEFAKEINEARSFVTKLLQGLK